MIAISTMMTTAFRCFSAFTPLPTAKANVTSSYPTMMVIDDSSKSSGPALPKKQAAKRPIEEEDVEQPRKRRKTLHTTQAKPVEQASVAELANAFGKLKISVNHADDATSVQDLTSTFRKLTLFTVDDDLARSFARLSISTDKAKNDTIASEKAITEDQMDIDSGYMMDLDDDDKTDIDNDDDDMDIDSGYMMDVDDDDETERMDTTD